MLKMPVNGFRKKQIKLKRLPVGSLFLFFFDNAHKQHLSLYKERSIFTRLVFHIELKSLQEGVIMERATLVFSAKILVLACLVAILSGCAGHSTQKHRPSDDIESGAEITFAEDSEANLEAEFEESDSMADFDPLSGYNRFMTQVNDRVYFWALKPVARGYGYVVPEPARIGVRRFFNNLLMPVRFVNNLLQLKPKQAVTELGRFTINSTAGLLGFFDPAAESFNLQPAPEDFGQTLGYYGIGSGFHIVLPLLGPSNLRDTVGLIPDRFLDPVPYVVDDWEARLALQAHETVNNTSLRIGEYESIKKDAIELYPFLRDAYEQRRDRMIEE